MIDKFSRKRLIGEISGIALAAIAACALAFTTPAMAAPVASARPAAVAGVATSLPSGFKVTHSTTGRLAVTRISAATSCGVTPVDQVNGTYFGVLVWWIKMQTSWCWNGSIVTSHSTSVTHWTASGYTYSGSYTYACQFGCNENSENVNGDPTVYFSNYAWNTHLWQNEFFNGTWSAGWSSTGYPI
jgi:hypothetical protein